MRRELFPSPKGLGGTPEIGGTPEMSYAMVAVEPGQLPDTAETQVGNLVETQVEMVEVENLKGNETEQVQPEPVPHSGVLGAKPKALPQPG